MLSSEQYLLKNVVAIRSICEMTEEIAWFILCEVSLCLAKRSDIGLRK
jgi:hypothetical protein